ncbi:hypothetical protein PHLCEN_2v9255 [Hermanssonia centrifuga]|uniref:Uncharacterized protein n=1 Tax=Hermanssonia centrifuga TaxID=98765 RepID=A0A2R6NR97_9APHY|nr:hypothetical protein PHLCEN_2v9255 [Hermanssonia centrifuga]
MYAIWGKDGRILATIALIGLVNPSMRTTYIGVPTPSFTGVWRAVSLARLLLPQKIYTKPTIDIAGTGFTAFMQLVVLILTLLKTASIWKVLWKSTVTTPLSILLLRDGWKSLWNVSKYGIHKLDVIIRINFSCLAGISFLSIPFLVRFSIILAHQLRED